MRAMAVNLKEIYAERDDDDPTFVSAKRPQKISPTPLSATLVRTSRTEMTTPAEGSSRAPAPIGVVDGAQRLASDS